MTDRSAQVWQQVTALLDQAAASRNEQEGQRHFGRAQQVMLRHSVDEALVSLRSDAPGLEPIRRMPFLTGGVNGRNESLLAAAVSAANCALVVEEIVPDLAGVEIVGQMPDITFGAALYVALLKQRETVLRDAPTQPGIDMHEQFARRAYDRLMAGRAQAETAVPGAAILREFKGKLVADKLVELYPDLHQGQVRATFPRQSGSGLRARDAGAAFDSLKPESGTDL
jgi:hypothetical protein